jgi:hypothetical protein
MSRRRRKYKAAKPRNQRVEDDAFHPQIRLGHFEENTASDGFCTKCFDASAHRFLDFRSDLPTNLCFSSDPFRNTNSIVTKGTLSSHQWHRKKSDLSV